MRIMFVTATLLASTAIAQGPAGKTATTTTETKAVATTTPLEACKGLVTAALNKDFNAVHQLTLTGPKHAIGKAASKGFEKMHAEHMARLQNLNCKTETVAMDHAFVETESEGGKRLIPFVKTEAGWKFDAKTYMSFYDFGPKHGGKKGKM